MIFRTLQTLPRLPLDGKLDITYRCNNQCVHCWLWIPDAQKTREEELSIDEVKRIVTEARQLGCQAWSISGGEPMLRDDFVDIFDFITNKSVTYKLNTNGTLITPKIAQLLKRKGQTMVALYGATPEIHDRITRSPGSFEAAMRGFRYLREAGVEFVVQIIPLRENFHQYQQMLELADSLSPVKRIGASWLWLTDCHSESRNREIINQRLNPKVVMELDEPDPVEDLFFINVQDSDSPENPCQSSQGEGSLFARCIEGRRDFHIDPYGQMSFCYYIKDPALRYDLRKGTFREAWEEFIPSLKDKVQGDDEYFENCGNCELRKDCRWCAVYGYLEHNRYTAKVEYLCDVAKENKTFKEEWKASHLRYYQIAGITLQVSADFPFKDDTFIPMYNLFRVDKPGQDVVSIRHHSFLPDVTNINMGKEIFRQPPWNIFEQRNSYIYRGYSAEKRINDPFLLAIFTKDHNGGNIYREANYYKNGNLHSLTSFVTDQMLIARLLADRQGTYLHSSGISINGQGVLFVGHSSAGKSTMMKMLREYGEILCDDRIIIRRWPDGFKIHGTWSHGELPDVSPNSAPLKAIFFIEKSKENRLIPITDKTEYLAKVLSHVVKPMITADWWEKIMDLSGFIVNEVPAYRLLFDKSGKVIDVINQVL